MAFFLITTASISKPTVNLQQNKTTNTKKLCFMPQKDVYHLPKDQSTGFVGFKFLHLSLGYPAHNKVHQ